MKPIFSYFVTPRINTELTEPHVYNQVSGANIQPHVVPDPEVSTEQTTNEGFDANILHALCTKHILSNEGSNASILQAPIEGFNIMMICSIERERERDLLELMTSKL